VGERRLAELAPRLVDLLDDDHVAVRRASVAALRKLSNVFYGFHPEASRRSRAGAVAKWRALWGTG
jgi:hypothetical protein